MQNRAVLSFLLLTISWLSTFVSLAKPPDKAVWARQVYARLLKAMGNPATAPRLLILPTAAPSATKTLVYQPGDKPGQPAQIEVASGVLTLCQQFGTEADAALACLLGHELAHFQYQHGSKQGFFSPVVAGSSARSSASSVNLEAVADRAGVFTAYLAGYDAFSLAPRVYARLYDAYHLPEQLPGYPGRAERLRLVADTAARVRELAQLWEAAELQYLLQDLDAASQTLTTLVARYPSAGTLNNLGVVKVNQALARMEPARRTARLRYAFPLEFDADNRLLASRRRADEPYLPLLNDALTLFQTALAADEANTSARLNAAITLYLLDRLPAARRYLSRLKTPNSVLMRAIVAADSTPAQAALLFREARRQGAFRATDNEQLFRATQQSTVEKLWVRWLQTRQRTQPDQRLLPPLPPRALWQQQATEVRLPSGIRFAQTDSATIYHLPITVNGSARLANVLRSSRVGLPGLPLQSPRSRLNAYRSPTGSTAGSRATVMYAYALPDGTLWLEYRDDRLAGWSWLRN